MCVAGFQCTMQYSLQSKPVTVDNIMRYDCVIGISQYDTISLKIDLGRVTARGRKKARGKVDCLR